MREVLANEREAARRLIEARRRQFERPTALDEFFMREAEGLTARQPRCDSTIFQLPSLSTPLSTDLIPIFHNGSTYAIQVSSLPVISSIASNAQLAALGIYNVKYYGAVGDGITDDTVAINAALQAVPSAGGIVFFPAGTYMISNCLQRQQSYTRIVGQGRNVTTIKVIASSVTNFVSPVNSTLGQMIDFAGSGKTDCYVSDLTLDGNYRGMASPPLNRAGGIFCGTNEIIERVSFYDINGFAAWAVGSRTIINDCDADLGGGNDCIGGGADRVLLKGFHWKSTMHKNTAVDFATNYPNEISMTMIGCVNDSAQNILFEGASNTTIIGNRFNGGYLGVLSDVAYNGSGGHTNVYNPFNFLIEGNTFVGTTFVSVQFAGGDNHSYPGGATLGGNIRIVNNSFFGPNGSAIYWAGEDATTSLGGCIISGNAIRDPNVGNITTSNAILDGKGNTLGSVYNCGISVTSGYNLRISDNTIYDEYSRMRYAVQIGRTDAANAGTNQVQLENNTLSAGAVGTLYVGNISPNPVVRNNQGVNPKGPIAGIAIPASTTPQTNTTGYDCMVAISGGTITQIAVGGQGTNLTSGTFRVPAGQTITLTYSVAPTIYTWIGD